MRGSFDRAQNCARYDNPGFEGIEAFIFDPPPGPSHPDQPRHVVLVDRHVRHPAVAVDGFSFWNQRVLEVIDRIGFGAPKKRLAKRLRWFRAGVESVISWIKRGLGFDCGSWKRFRSFGSFDWPTIATANLRHLPACNRPDIVGQLNFSGKRGIVMS